MTNANPCPDNSILYFFSDKFRLTGNLHLPEETNPPVVIGSHGLFANRHSPKQIALARLCISVGIGYFRFDHRGCGDSQGDFAQKLSFAGRCRDLLNACDIIQNRNDTGNRIALFGSSLGGAVALFAASVINVESVITFAAPLNSKCVLEAVKKSNCLKKPASTPIVQLMDYDLYNRLPKICNVLIIHGEADEIVPVSHAQIIFDRVSSPKEIRIQQQGDHRMNDPSHQEAFGRLCVQWFQKGFKT